MQKIYLAGFDVFYTDAPVRFERMKQLCKLAGYEPLAPLDNDVTDALDIAGSIYNLNIEMLNKADGILANLNAFRGAEPDSGTVFEVGYGVAKGKKIVGYTSITDWATHIASRTKADLLSSLFTTASKESFNIENFGLPLNLMLSKSIHIVNGDFIDALEKYKSLELEAEA